jgi:hypothetical protein
MYIQVDLIDADSNVVGSWTLTYAGAPPVEESPW